MQTKTVRWSNNGLAKAPASAPAASAAISQAGGARDAQQMQHPLQQVQQQQQQPQQGLVPAPHAPADAFPGRTTTGFSLPDGQAGQPSGQERAGSQGAPQPIGIGLRGNPPDQ